MKSGSKKGVLYSTDGGNMCPRCGQPRKKCVCSRIRPLNTGGDGIVRVGRETKGRKGAGVTTISGVQGTEVEIKALAKELKKSCGSGGTVKGGTIEIQGEHRDTLVVLLTKKGYTAKKSGG